jgi:pimeloyl-ACP methyl ester carboxylesterase
MNTRTRLSRTKAAAFAAVVAGVIAVTLPAQIGNASVLPKSVEGGSSQVKPTIVLVHGAWADGSSFAPETAALQLAGYTVLLAPNPLRGLAEDTKAVSDFITQRTSGPVVLVGHSYGGMVITGAALSDPDVKALVYVDAYAPDAGDSAQSLTNALPGSLLNVTDPSTVFDVVKPAPDAPQLVWDSYIRQDRFKAVFAASLPTTITKVLGAGQSPVTFGALGTPFQGTSAWETIPSWFFIGTADQVIPVAEQRVMAGRANGKVTEGNAPHLSMLANPVQVTKVIVDAAKSVR